MSRVTNHKEGNFRVIVVGAGVTGLIMSHALSKARIDHVVLESHPQVVHATGGSFGLWPNAARILVQLGCWEHMEAICEPLHWAQTRTPDGRMLVTSNVFDRVTARHGFKCLALERQAYLDVLYSKAPEKHKILTGKELKDIWVTDRGVIAVLGDGTCEEGDMIVGCDGVHSTVRKIMWDRADKLAPGVITASEKTSLRSDFSCLVGVAPPVAGIGSCDSITISHQDLAIQIISQPDIIFFFVCIKQATPTSWPDKRRYTQEDMEKEATRISRLPVNEHVLFGDIWTTRSRGYLTSLEEGLFRTWWFERMVLIGDAAHKMSPVLAHGGNCGLESAAALVNALKARLDQNDDRNLSREDLAAVFREYQSSRYPRVKQLYDLVHKVTRIQTTDGILKRFLVRWVLPVFKSDAMAASAFIRQTVRLNFLPMPERPAGSIGFDDERTPEGVAPTLTEKKSMVEIGALLRTGRRISVVLPLLIFLTLWLNHASSKVVYTI